MDGTVAEGLHVPHHIFNDDEAFGSETSPNSDFAARRDQTPTFLVAARALLSSKVKAEPTGSGSGLNSLGVAGTCPPFPPPPPGQCGVPLPYPPWRVPAKQDYRPRVQTQEQASIVAARLQDAATESAAAEPWLKSLLGSIRPSLHNLPCAKASVDELVQIFAWEFEHFALMHNGPIVAAPAINDDTILQTTLDNLFIQSVPNRYVMGVEGAGPFRGESSIMETYMGYSPYKSSDRPLLREANGRILYLANNIQKANAGNFQYGEVTYVFNQPTTKSRFFIAPYDTGAYCHRFKHTPFGSFAHFFHLLQPHFSVLHRVLSEYTLAVLFQRWYGGHKAIPVEFLYTELEYSANAWLPDALLYINPRFTTLWGTGLGTYLQQWSIDNRRPVVWADGDDSGMLLDPFVGQAALTSPNITSAMVSWFQTMWTSGISWHDLYNTAPKELQFELPSYYRSRTICAAEEAAGLAVMGSNKAGACVYWTPPPNVSAAWECTNDGGGCVPTSRPLTPGVIFANETTCNAQCSNGRYSCRQNEANSGCAGKNGIMCVPDPYGDCPDLATCEAQCQPKHVLEGSSGAGADNVEFEASLTSPHQLITASSLSSTDSTAASGTSSTSTTSSVGLGGFFMLSSLNINGGTTTTASCPLNAGCLMETPGLAATDALVNREQVAMMMCDGAHQCHGFNGEAFTQWPSDPKVDSYISTTKCGSHGKPTFKNGTCAPPDAIVTGSFMYCGPDSIGLYLPLGAQAKGTPAQIGAMCDKQTACAAFTTDKGGTTGQLLSLSGVYAPPAAPSGKFVPGGFQPRKSVSMLGWYVKLSGALVSEDDDKAAIAGGRRSEAAKAAEFAKDARSTISQSVSQPATEDARSTIVEDHDAYTTATRTVDPTGTNFTLLGMIDLGWPLVPMVTFDKCSGCSSGLDHSNWMTPATMQLTCARNPDACSLYIDATMPNTGWVTYKRRRPGRPTTIAYAKNSACPKVPPMCGFGQFVKCTNLDATRASKLRTLNLTNDSAPRATLATACNANITCHAFVLSMDGDSGDLYQFPPLHIVGTEATGTYLVARD